MAEYVRVTDAVKPRREYSIQSSRVTDAHEVLDKPAVYADGAPIPPKYSPARMAKKTSVAESAADKQASQSAANSEKEN